LANGVALAYDDVGAGDPPFLFIHGLAGSRSVFPDQVAHFARSHRVVAYDQRGHGDSDRPDDGRYDLWTLADDARQLADALGLDHPVVVGHSLGGTVAIALAARYPEFPRALVVLDSVFELRPDSRRTLQAFYESLADGTDDAYEAAVEVFVRTQLTSPGDDPAVVASAVALMTSLPREVFVALGTSRLGFDDVAAAKGVTAPALFVGSARPFCDLASVRANCPGWYLGRVVGSGHKLQLLVPDQVNAMIDRFLSLVDAGFPHDVEQGAF